MSGRTPAPEDLRWDGGHLDGTPWQGIRYLSMTVDATARPAVVVVAHLNRPAGALQAGDIAVTGGGRVPPPAHTISVLPDQVVVEFVTWGDHSEYRITLTGGAGEPLHPFHASAAFHFTIDCERGDCRDEAHPATALPTDPPAVDLLTKDYTGFVALLSDRVRVADPELSDLSSPSFERVLLELLAWAGDLTSYYQDRIAAEAFVDTARQRYSLRQHAVLLGERLDDGRSATTVLAIDPEVSGVVPAGLTVRVPTAPDERPVLFTVTERTRVRAENTSPRLVPAAFPGAADAVMPAGARRLLLLGHGAELAAGDRLAFRQGAWSQVVSVTQPPTRFAAPGWVAHPADPVDPASDPPAEVTEVRFEPPLDRPVLPWSDPPLQVHANLVDARAGGPRRAVLAADPAAGEVELSIGPRSAVVARGPGGHLLLRALRVPEWPVAMDDGPRPEDATAPAVDILVSGERWSRVEHLQASQSYDGHFTAAADEDGAVWLQFGDGVTGREVRMAAPERPVQTIELRYRTGDFVAGNVGHGLAVDIVRPPTGTDEQVTLDGLGAVTALTVAPGTGGRAPAPAGRIKELLPASLASGQPRRAVTPDDYAAVAAGVAGVERARARVLGGVFNTVAVLVDPAGGGQLPEAVLDAVSQRLDGLRMTGREVRVLPADYLPLEVTLDVCAEAGVPGDVVRRRVLAELRPGTPSRPGWFHPDRLSFGDAVRLGDLLAVVHEVTGVRAVRADVFRPLGEGSGPAVRPVITLGTTAVARLDADPDHPENGRLEVRVVGLDAHAVPFLADAPGDAG
ncbi:MAG: hypothetical protein ACFCVF_16475 [Kineosporiaceae bacterium]